MDAYWLTLSRPDHRESDRFNSLGPKLVHAGPQVYYVLMRASGAMMIPSHNPVPAHGKLIVFFFTTV
jgi:hypothetical protein